MLTLNEKNTAHIPLMEKLVKSQMRKNEDKESGDAVARPHQDNYWKYRDYGGIFLPRGSQIAIAIIFLIFQKIKSFPENIIAITSII